MSNFDLNFGRSIWNWRAIGRGLCFALMLVMVMPVSADVKVEKRSLGDNLVKTLTNWWESLWNSSHGKTNGFVRNGEFMQLTKDSLVVPFLEGTISDAKLIAGEQDIYFLLKGGVPPYTVEVKKEGSTVQKKLADNNEVAFNLALEEGAHYWVTIKDSSTTKPVKTKFQVVADFPIPTNAKMLDIKNSLDSLPSCVQWLANHSDGEWAFQAYQLSIAGKADKIKTICGI